MCTTQCKITDIIKTGDKKSYSFEVTPNIREDQLLTFDADVKPLFFSITWHATLHECRNLDITPLKLAKFLKKNNKNVLLHLSCTLLRESFAKELLIMLQKEGICNLFVILGEKYNPAASDFQNTQDLIRYIRKTTGNYFCIGVAGFPDREHNFQHLMDKVDSGADFIITQAFFDVKVYGDFIIKCKLLGIAVPIFAGIFPFETEKEISGFINLCKVQVTRRVLEDFKNRRGNEIVSKLMQDLWTALKVNRFHFFTLDNIERTIKVIKTELSFETKN